MARPQVPFSALPADWQKWLSAIEKLNSRWKRLERARKTAADKLKTEDGLSDAAIRKIPDYREKWDAAETARIERAEAFRDAKNSGVSVYRIAKHLGYPKQAAIDSAIQSIEGRRAIYRR